MATGKLSLFVLLLIVLIAGCSDVPTEQLSPEQQKAQLLNRIQWNFEDADAHYQLGKIYEAQGRLDGAEYEYDLAARFAPMHLRTRAALVDVYRRRGLTGQAQQYARRQMQQVADQPKRAARLAQAFADEGLDDYAVRCYQQALQLNSQSTLLLNSFAQYYLEKGDREKAKEYYTRSFNIDPYQPEVAKKLGQLGVVVQALPETPEQETTEE